MESLDYYSTNNTLNTFMTALFGAAAGVVAIISALIGIALYLLLAYAYYRMAKNRGLPHAWAAWIPIAQLYLLGMLIDRRVYFGSAKISNAHVLLPIGFILVPAVAFIPIIGYLYGVAYTIYAFAAHYRLYRLYGTSNQALVFLILSIIFPVTEPFFVFVLRNKPSVEYQTYF